ncbi:LPS assembly lipoprotein LptE [Bordetella petrii]|uniref:LPS-assembly lipoprotein LptE n=1 Tax=Bordetella petrii TaxID=94624 RepID=A0ABT7W771_9BORD|nr:LPS assembly lipoprotein LptE [Bordetella petrii]MDM9561020.1 LPS assembly lipoprotein LptE [Bordetella petrii]
MHFAWHRPQFLRPRWLLRGASLAAVLLLAACGFALRGVTPLPFDTLYIGIPDNTRFGADVRRALRAASPNTRLVDEAGEAQAALQMVRNERTLREVSLNAQGRVEEYELGIIFTFRLISNQGAAILPDTTLSVYREMPYDDQVVQAKQGQIESLYQSMQQSLVSRLVRRLTAPDVRDAAAAAQRGESNPDAPVYDPAPPTAPRQPEVWQTPSSPGTGNW